MNKVHGKLNKRGPVWETKHGGEIAFFEFPGAPVPPEASPDEPVFYTLPVDCTIDLDMLYDKWVKSDIVIPGYPEPVWIEEPRFEADDEPGEPPVGQQFDFTLTGTITLIPK